ncbi:unnamed protein product [Allacma fusca]|uniref:Uncharacterized protein n=1 Tax=Allacma fusca TaxID=39272 RepID=A0A8J2NWQ4_9HEXA|nr:unnamed protein product [Allacma fusca]
MTSRILTKPLKMFSFAIGITWKTLGSLFHIYSPRGGRPIQNWKLGYNLTAAKDLWSAANLKILWNFWNIFGAHFQENLQ